MVAAKVPAPPKAPSPPGPPAGASSPPVESVPVRAAPAAEAGRVYAVQVGAFRVPNNARRLAGRLRAEGYDVYSVRRSDGRGGSLTYVFTAPVADRGQATKTAERLKGLGIKGFVRRAGASAG
jgi:DedD protein